MEVRHKLFMVVRYHLNRKDTLDINLKLNTIALRWCMYIICFSKGTTHLYAGKPVPEY